MVGALAGVRVVDLSRVLAGPYCTMMLGDLGAEVVKIELPGAGDDTRHWGPPFVGGESAYYLAVNRNKKSVTLNLKSDAGRDILRQLVKQADVVVENFKVGTMARWGFDDATLRADNPGLINCTISAYGTTGPFAEQPGYDFTVQAIGGIMSVTGEPEGEPMKVGVAIVDITAGLYASTAILAALSARSRDGLGQRIEVSLLQAQLAWLANVGSNYLISGEVPVRHGNAHPNIVPYQAFRARDRYLVVAVGNDSQWRALCDALERPDLAAERGYATNPDRVRNRVDLVTILQGIFEQRNADDWLDRLERAGVPAAPINTLDRVFADPRVQALNPLVEAAHPTAGTVRLVRWPFDLDRTPATLTAAPPLLGADTDAVLSEQLGLEPAELARLRADGAI